jgi:uncharacterized protein YdcH (DUF465 family)
MHSHPPGQIFPIHNLISDPGEVTRSRRTTFMEQHTHDEDVKAHLLETSEQFRTLAEQHALLKHQIEEIESKPHVTGTDELEEQRLKKMKLHLKDRMNEMLSNYKHASVH